MMLGLRSLTSQNTGDVKVEQTIRFAEFSVFDEGKVFQNCNGRGKRFAEQCCLMQSAVM